MPVVADKPRKPADSGKIDPDSPHRARIARLRKLLAPSGADSILITNPLDVGYLTGFFGGESFLLVGPPRPILISDFRYEEELEPIKPLAEIHIRDRGIFEASAAILGDRRIPRCAVQAEHLNLADHDKLSKLVAPAKLVPTTKLVEQLRVIKDESEIALMRRATKLQEEALQAVLPTIRPGQTELAVAARLESEMKTRGSSKPGFETIIAARANGSLPHYRPGHIRLAINKPLLIDWGATYRGYQSDMTRTFSLGKWPRKIAEIYKIVLDAQQLAAAALAPGRTTREIDSIARDYITRHGYGKEFGHGLGHGLGISKEPPFLHHLYEPLVLQPGHVTTVEPGIYLPGIGGVRIEDIYVIRESGAENLCSLPKDMAWSTI